MNESTQMLSLTMSWVVQCSALYGVYAQCLCFMIKYPDICITFHCNNTLEMRFQQEPYSKDMFVTVELRAIVTLIFHFIVWYSNAVYMHFHGSLTYLFSFHKLNEYMQSFDPFSYLSFGIFDENRNWNEAVDTFRRNSNP